MRLQVLNQGKNAFENFFLTMRGILWTKNLFRIIHESHLAILFFLHFPFYAVLEG